MARSCSPAPAIASTVRRASRASAPSAVLLWTLAAAAGAGLVATAAGAAAGPATTAVATGGTGATAAPPALLATVDDDSVTTLDLDLELALLREKAGQDSALAVPPPDAVLKRLIQNCLLTREGYRLGADRSSTVRNQVRDWARRQAMSALLDSIAAQVPASRPGFEAERRSAVERYIGQLKQRYAARVDTALLASLDYASADPQVQARLRDGGEIVASGPMGTLTVKELTQEIRFTYFHGLQDRADAAEIRDKACEEWLVESLLRQEIKAHNLEARPGLRRAAREMECGLVRDEALTTITSIRFKPTDKEVAAYYAAHGEELRAPARVKVQSALLKDQAAARRFSERLQQGAKLKWLAERTPEVQAGVTPFPAEWLDLNQLGLRPQDAVAGRVLEPYEVPGGWAAAVIAEVLPGEIPPLDAVRSRLLSQMKSERVQAAVKEALARLEAAARIRVRPDALVLVAEHLATVRGGRP